MMLTFVKSQLKSLNDDATCKEFGHLIDVMCNWGRGEDLLDFITEHLQGTLADLLNEQSAGTVAQGRRKGAIVLQVFLKTNAIYNVLFFRYWEETCFFSKTQ